MTRDKFTVKFTKTVFSNKEGMRLATPEIVAKYIAKRLKTDIIADLGCGIGGQVIFFAKECKKVYAVEKNLEKLEYAKKNCDLYNVRNVEFIHGDALSESTKKMVSDADIIFSDPARPISETKRTLENLQPPVAGILSLYSDITQEFAFHAPPQMDAARIGMDCEREYLSLNGQLNRLTLYFGSLKECERSAVIIPGGERLCSSGSQGIEDGKLMEYVYEPEPSIVKADLLGELSGKINLAGDSIFLFRGREKRTLLTSSILLDSPFFKDRFRVVDRTSFDIPTIKKILISEKAGKVLLRFDIEPEKYWELRKTLEDGLSGSRILHLFGFRNEIIICEKIRI